MQNVVYGLIKKKKKRKIEMMNSLILTTSKMYMCLEASCRLHSLGTMEGLCTVFF